MEMSFNNKKLAKSLPLYNPANEEWKSTENMHATFNLHFKIARNVVT